MKKIMLGGIAAIAIGLAGAPVANADDYTSADRNFLAAIAQDGYYGDKDRLIKTGHMVCGLLDDGANYSTIQAEIIIHHGRGRDSEGYHAAWFENYAVYYYCPRHRDKIGVT